MLIQAILWKEDGTQLIRTGHKLVYNCCRISKAAMAFGRLTLSLLVLFSLAICVIGARDLAETSTTSSAPVVPAMIQVPAGYKLQQAYSAKGYQYYTFNGSTWCNTNASAVLKNSKDQQVARHFFLANPDAQGGQPTWETLPSTSNGVAYSKVTGKTLEKVVKDTDSIAWVLLEATESVGDKFYFGAVAYVQRYDTKHGNPPKSTSGASKGDIVSSRYSANYAFYVRAW